MDSKVSPLAMLTQACNKIESSMLGMANKTPKPALSPSRESPKRARSDSSEGDASSPTLKQPRLSTPQEKVSQPLASSEKRKTPERRPSTTTSSSLASPSSASAVVTSRASSQPGLYPGFPPMLAGYPHFAAPPSAHVGPCTNPMCTDVTCPTGAARASFLMGLPPHPSMSLMNLMHPPPALAAATPPASPYVCNWMAGGEFCGRRFDSSEDLMGHLRTHTAAASTAPVTPTSTVATSLAAFQAAQAALISSTVAPVMSTSTSASALAALQAQAAKMAASPSSSSGVSTDLAAAAAARYHAALVTRPGLPPPPPMPALPPHLASLYGLSNPYSMPMIYPMP